MDIRLEYESADDPQYVYLLLEQTRVVPNFPQVSLCPNFSAVPFMAAIF